MIVAAAPTARAVSPAPADVPRDSVSVRWEEGAELSRLIGAVRANRSFSSTERVLFTADWITGLSRGLSSEGRLRHDVRWNTSVEKNLSRLFSLWSGASGQHYVDRPRNNSQSFAQENRSHLARAGLGPSVRWNRFLNSEHGAGLIADSRDDVTESGFGTWSRGEFSYRGSPNSLHDADAHFEYEAPGGRVGSDAGLSYNLRQDYGASANEAMLQIGWTRREIMSSTGLPPQLRQERIIRIQDELAYEVGAGAVLRGTGDLRYLDTRLDDRRDASSRLEELESGFNGELALAQGRSRGSFSAGFRSATQTVRGEILSGQKTELALRGQTKVRGSSLRARAAFSKYTLDTRSEDNFDDRDELAWRFEIGTTSRVNSHLTAEVQALADLNHLVYIFGRNSANNRWTRLILLTSRLVHVPGGRIVHVPEFRISASYQAYDFELNPRQVRSTVFRRVMLGDSLSVQLNDRWNVAFRADVSREELGRLFWDDFEQERSDQTDMFGSAFQITRRLSDSSTGGVGAAYGRRLSDRFEEEGNPRRVLDIESWGPLARLEWEKDSWFINLSGQLVMQHELNRDDRNFVSGSLTAGRAW